MTGEGPTSKLSQVIGRFHFLSAVGFMSAYFFKASNREKESASKTDLYNNII